MKNTEKTLNPLAAIRYLATEYFPQEVPFAIRSAAAYAMAEDLFAEGCDPEITEEDLVEWASDLAFRPLAGGAWVLVDLADGGEPWAVLEPKAEGELATA